MEDNSPKRKTPEETSVIKANRSARRKEKKKKQVNMLMFGKSHLFRRQNRRKADSKKESMHLKL